MPSSGVQTCARSEEHTSELQSHDNLVCRLLLEKRVRSEEHTSELQSHDNLVCRLLLEKKRHGSEFGRFRARVALPDERLVVVREGVECMPRLVQHFFFIVQPPPRFHEFPLPPLLPY